MKREDRVLVRWLVESFLVGGLLERACKQSATMLLIFAPTGISG